ncbi:hypothetical protein L6164_024641 [Bauhinia variegata]|uniref:Uncharacterized protein n=1 Tax=Bauhinia variegata TaxID=167791 RepID=A0ACB9LYE7_BAUVA|nr:hypothetical protein L6164_024641 [Bauhinia variegata]
MLSAYYIQKGLLFRKPQNDPDLIKSLLERLKHSLSIALFHFHPLSGRFVTPNPPSYFVLSEIFQAKGHQYDIGVPISCPPILNRWFPEGHGPKINLPFKHHDEFIRRFQAPKLRQRIFHFSAESTAKLKAKANRESNTNKISSFQSLSALVWRSLTRARRLPYDQTTTCKLATNNRTRMEPPLPKEYLGNSIHAVGASATAGELLQHDLGWAAWKLHLAVANHNDTAVRQYLEKWLESPA